MNVKQQQILQAAIMIVKEQGVEKLTLEAAAKQAGISKGGLLYYFPNKDALLSAMFHYLNEDFNTGMQAKAMALPQERGKWAQAYLSQVHEDIQKENGFGYALIAALFADPSLLEQLQEQYNVWQQQLESDGMDVVDATIMRLVADGLWLSDLLNVAKVQPPLLDQIMERISQWTATKE